MPSSSSHLRQHIVHAIDLLCVERQLRSPLQKEDIELDRAGANVLALLQLSGEYHLALEGNVNAI